MKIKKGDNVIIISGKYRAKNGKVLRVFPALRNIFVEGIVYKKHKRTKSQGKKGEVIEVPFPVSIASVKLLCPNCGKGTRVGYMSEGNKKYRICKKCQSRID